jgi:hypothetical protein
MFIRHTTLTLFIFSLLAMADDHISLGVEFDYGTGNF